MSSPQKRARSSSATPQSQSPAPGHPPPAPSPVGPPQTRTATKRSNPLFGVLPFIGVILFLISAISVLGSGSDSWERDLLTNAVVYLIGWAGIGGGISHIFFGPKISASIGWTWSPFELEIGLANLGFGVAAVLAASFSPDYSLALIIANSVFRVGAGIGHIRSMITDRNFAVNNTAILFVDFVVPAFLFWAYFAWS
jgi:hypothetical protein